MSWVGKCLGRRRRELRVERAARSAILASWLRSSEGRASLFRMESMYIAFLYSQICGRDHWDPESESLQFAQ